MRYKNKLWIGTIKTYSDIEIWLYTNLSHSIYFAVVEKNGEVLREVKTKSWRRFINELKKEINKLNVYDSTKNLWVDRWLWTNKPLHQYILDY